MSKVFLDTSVLFSAVYSQQGAARDLIRIAIQGKVELVVSALVLEETERNIVKKASHKLETYKTFVNTVGFTVIDDPTKEEVAAALVYTVLKDAPIVAAAIKAQPDYLATYDRKDLLDPPQVTAQSGLNIVTPDVVVNALGGVDESSN